MFTILDMQTQLLVGRLLCLPRLNLNSASTEKSSLTETYGWTIPLKTKTGPEVMTAFQSLCRKQPPPQKLWTYRGTECYNKPMKDLLEKNNVELYSTENEEKSSIV